MRDSAKATIKTLIERFHEHLDEYHLPDYNEQKTRLDFINPFFKALGWDIDNEKGDSEAYREVIYEDKVFVRGKCKAPDYGFRLSGSGKKRLFYVEAKKPSVALKVNREAAYQLRRYGSSAQAFISILTNFEDFIVYDCSRVPNLNDNATVARLKHIHFEDYLKEFDFIYDTFSHEAVTKGRFDKFVQSGATKKGTDTLDKRFLQSLDQWRKYLACSIALHNRNLNDDELNFAVQQNIDRFIFLRFCEDRSIEPYGQLQKAVAKGDAFKNLFVLLQQADDKYNSGLFDFEKDVITPKLKIDNKVLKTIIDDLYYPKCNYEFSVMPVEILGNAYEQFLGKVIRITPARGVKIEEKPEVRKAGGVYYTPQYIVEYIVKNTVGKLIEGKTPKDIAKIKIVDPACGSGSFLLGAFEFILNYHVNWYHQNGYAAKKSKDNPFTPQGTLAPHEKKRILLNNIFGVDIDANAVEVTKLSLLLKCLEGETEASIKQQMSMFHERVLPDLDNNIKDGNSLIDTDIYDTEIDLGFEKKIKPFNWQKAFPDVFKLREKDRKEDFKTQFQLVKQQTDNIDLKAKTLIEKYLGKVEEATPEYGKKSGFDIVIGNPPYFSLSTLDSYHTNYFNKKYKVFENTTDIYCLFYEKSIEILKQDGLVSFITSNQWLQTNYGKILRNFIIKNTNPELLINFGGVKIFQDATVDTSILILSKTECQNKLTACHFKNDFTIGSSINEYISKHAIVLDNLNTEKWTIAKANLLELKNKLKQKGEILKKWKVKINRGLLTGLNEAFIINKDTKDEIIRKDKNAIKIIKQILRGRDVHKNSVQWAGLWLIVTKNGIDINDYPSIYTYLKSFGDKIKSRIDQGDNWWNLRACSYYDLFEKEKIIYPETTVRRSEFYYDNKGCYIDKTCFMITGKNLKYLNGVLSSKLMEWFLESELRLLGKRSIQYSKQFIEQVPVPKITNNNLSFAIEIVKHVDILLKLNEDIKAEKLQNKIEQIKQRIEHSEEKINQLVYQLYELTDEEIKIIEGSKSE